MQRRIIPTLLTIALLVSSLLSILTIHSLQGNARIINYTGVVRGATQRLVKQELHGEPNDRLFQRLDGILTELASGKGKNSLEYLDDDDYQELIDQMQTQWDSLKDEIRAVRQGANGTRLYTLSENYFSLADQAVLAAEIYAEKQVQQAERVIHELEPRPGAPFERPSQVPYILPDLFVEEMDGHLVVRLRNENHSMFHINRNYQALIRQS